MSNENYNRGFELEWGLIRRFNAGEVEGIRSGVRGGTRGNKGVRSGVRGGTRVLDPGFEGVRGY